MIYLKHSLQYLVYHKSFIHKIVTLWLWFAVHTFKLLLVVRALLHFLRQYIEVDLASGCEIPEALSIMSVIDDAQLGKFFICHLVILNWRAWVLYQPLDVTSHLY